MFTFFFLFIMVAIICIIPKLSLIFILILLLFLLKVSIIALIYNSFDDFYYNRKIIPWVFYDSFNIFYVEYKTYCTGYVYLFRIGMRYYFIFYSFFFYLSGFFWVNLFLFSFLIYKALKPFLWRYLLFRIFSFIFLFTIIICFLRYSIFFFMITNYPVHTSWWLLYMYTSYYYFIDTMYKEMIERIRSDIDTLFVIFLTIVGTGLHIIPPV